MGYKIKHATPTFMYKNVFRRSYVLSRKYTIEKCYLTIQKIAIEGETNFRAMAI